MRRISVGVSAIALSVATGLVMPSFAMAQTEPATSPQAVETIVVTAQKRPQRLVDVPVAVTSISGEAIRNAGISDTSALQQIAPSVTYSTSLGTQYASIKIRGVGSFTTNNGVESSSAFIVDGIGLSRPGQGLTDMVDVASVEVLRGPQGTLFGKGTTAGAVLINMRRPSDAFTVLADATIAEGDEVRVSASVSGPLSERVRGRLTGFVNDVPGHIYNIFDGKNVNGSTSSGVRAKLEFDVTDSLNVLLSADYNDSGSICCVFIPLQSSNPTSKFLQASVGLVPSETNTNVWFDSDSFNRDRHEGVTLEANLDWHRFKVTSLTGFKRWRTESNADGDNQGVVRPVFTTSVLTVSVSKLERNYGLTDLEQFSQEFRISSPKEGNFNYVAGLYYGDMAIDRVADRRVGGCLPVPGFVPNTPCPSPIFRSVGLTATTGTINYAAFGQADWKIADRLTLVLGLRAQNEKVSFTGNRGGPIVAGDQPLAAPSVGGGSTEDSVVTGKFSAGYKFTNNLNAYVSYTEGYKGAAYDIEASATFATQKAILPETVDSTELGVKWVSNDGRFGANFAAYESNFQNLQVQTYQSFNGILSFVVANSGQSTAKGAELEFFARPLRNLRISGGYAYSDTAFDLDGSTCNQLQPIQILPVGTTPPGNTCYKFVGEGPTILARQNVRDGILTGAPQHRFNATARYDAPLTTSLNWFVQGSVRYQSENHFLLDQNPLAVEEPKTIFDASFGVGRNNGQYQLSFFVKNLTNEFYRSGISIDNLVATPASPYELVQFVPKDAKRFFGINLRVEY